MFCADNLDWYQDVRSREFDIHSFKMDATADEIYEFVQSKYVIESITKGYKYWTYNTPKPVEESLWAYTVVEAIAACAPPPASSKTPKLLEPGRQMYLKGVIESRCMFYSVFALLFVVYVTEINLFTFSRCCHFKVHC